MSFLFLQKSLKVSFNSQGDRQTINFQKGTSTLVFSIRTSLEEYEPKLC